MNADFVVRMTGRWHWIATFAALSATTAYWYMNEPVREGAGSTSPAPIPGSSSRPAETPPAISAEPGRPERSRDGGDLFAPRTWEPPPPIVSTPAPPPPPQAPPLPFKFFGRIADPTQTPSFILSRGTEMITVRVGDRIEPTYLVDKFDGTQLHLVYLPLNVRQTIFVGNANE